MHTRPRLSVLCIAAALAACSIKEIRYTPEEDRPGDANGDASCSDQVKNGDETDFDCGGPICGQCTSGMGCTADGDCTSNHCGTICGACTASSECAAGMACIDGTCQHCTQASQCDDGRACVDGVCGPCSVSTQCATGDSCNFGACQTGHTAEMYKCPSEVTLFGGRWAFYGCHGQTRRMRS